MTTQATETASSLFTVVKRNGTLVPFRKERIYRALEAAFRDTKKVSKSDPLSEEYKESVDQMTDIIVAEILRLASKGACLTVEGIQDLVEVMLMKNDHHDVARDYIIYRDQHKALRDDSPQNVKITREDGSLVRFNPMKIASSIEEAFRRTRHTLGPSSQTIIEAVNLLTQKIVARAMTLSKAQTLTTAMVQDEIEQQLMREGFYGVAKDFIISRAGIQPAHPPVHEALEEKRDEKKVHHLYGRWKGQNDLRTIAQEQTQVRLPRIRRPRLL